MEKRLKALTITNVIIKIPFLPHYTTRLLYKLINCFVRGIIYINPIYPMFRYPINNT